MEIHEELLFLSEQDVMEVFTPADAIAATEEVFREIGRGNIDVGEITFMFADRERGNNFHSMPAILHHRHVAGVKWIDTFASPPPGYLFNHGNLVILSDTNTGSPFAIVGATNITAMRTAGGHGVVQAKHLANPNPTVLSVFGCGSQAKAGIRGFITQFPEIKQVRLFSRSDLPMRKVQEELRKRVEVVICDTPQMALEGSNLILMASGAKMPLISHELIRPGTTIIGMEGFRDLDPQIALMANKWYLGYKKPDQSILRRFEQASGKTNSLQYVFGDMTELLNGKVPGREREDEIIVSTHMGMGAHDVACAYVVYQRAKEKGLGRLLQLS